MKYRFPAIVILTVFGLFLSFPKQVFTGAENGLMLWFQIMVPTLFPFMILLNLMVNTSIVHTLSRLFAPVFGRIFQVSPYGTLAVFTGFLCGYPMGSKVTADLLKNGYITISESQYLLSFCNNTSLSFIVSFLISQTLHCSDQMIPSLIILFLSPFTVSIFTRKIHRPSSMYGMNYASESLPSFNFRHPVTLSETLDRCMMNSFESMLKIGCYMMIFSILIVFCRLWFPKNFLGTTILLSSLELTNGLVLLSKNSLTTDQLYILSLALTSFGGWCAAAQTYTMIQGTKLKLFPYIIEKLATMLVTSLYALCYLLLR